MDIKNTKSKKITIIASKDTWIEDPALEQLEKMSMLPGVERVVALPDLHPGKGIPVGAVFAINEMIYPYLIGNDIGCGIGLWKTAIKKKKVKRDAWVKKLFGLENSYKGNLNKWFEKYNIPPIFEHSLGTIGGGNHFAELQLIEKIFDKDEFDRLNLRKDILYLLVHSGSRGLGEQILREHVDKYRAAGLLIKDSEAKDYLTKHDNALKWARANRDLIAQRISNMIGTESNQVLDAVHNAIEKNPFHKNLWLHRKGVVPSDRGPVVIPGSRGNLSYLVKPAENQEENLFSIAHGAGRKWKRGEMKGRLKTRYKKEDLYQTRLGSVVICEDKNLLFEEAPEAYKNIDNIILDLQNFNLVKVIATLKPLITYKVRTR